VSIFIVITLSPYLHVSFILSQYLMPCVSSTITHVQYVNIVGEGLCSVPSPEVCLCPKWLDASLDRKGNHSEGWQEGNTVSRLLWKEAGPFRDKPKPLCHVRSKLTQHSTLCSIRCTEGKSDTEDSAGSTNCGPSILAHTGSCYSTPAIFSFFI
jgi:hypothetical protein